MSSTDPWPQAPDLPRPAPEPGADREWVVLVDAEDRAIGTAEKLAAHREGGRLHRAFSVFLFDARGNVLLQQRARGKYHFPLLWTNACCGHPRPGEAVDQAARRRVWEELGVEVDVAPAFAFVYRAEDTVSGLTEHEYDHVLVGRLAGEPEGRPQEVAAVAWWEPAALVRDVARRPERYTPWFRVALERLDARGLLSGWATRRRV